MKNLSTIPLLVVFFFISAICITFLLDLFPRDQFETSSNRFWTHFGPGAHVQDKQAGTLDPCDAQSNSPEATSDLRCVLKRAAMEDSTVIITTLNDVWAQPGSLLDLFFTGFHAGNQTQHLLKHLVIVALDSKAYNRCLELHPHCFLLMTESADFSGEKVFMSEDYIGMMWRRIDFLRHVLDVGFNFVFTDTDIMWLRNPFPHLHDTRADFAVACDMYMGNSTDMHNGVNGGFTYVKSNNRTIQFYKHWYDSRERFPGEHDQQVLNRIKEDSFVVELGVRLWFLDTDVISGFCEHGKDLRNVCTMHSNCCIGLENKIHDLKLVLEDWGNFTSTLSSEGNASAVAWRIPSSC